MDKAILVVSFGTSHKAAREKTIDKITEDIKAEYTQSRVYSAFTSYMITEKLKREGICIYNTEEAFEKIADDGIVELTVQPTHIIKGYEYEKLCGIAEKYRPYFDKLKIGEPLLSYEEDFIKTAEFIRSIKSDEDALVLMGHGTGHSANAVYDKLRDYIGQDDIFIGTVEAKPNVYDIAEKIKDCREILLTPLMLVAGDHVVNDMAGDAPDSWKNIFTSMGVGVKILLKGLGEYEFIRNIFLEHIRRAI